MTSKNTPTQKTENDIYTKRLIVREGHSRMRGTLSKCIIKYRDFIKQAQKVSSENEETKHESLTKLKELASSLKLELQLNNLEIQKMEFMSLTSKDEDEYNKVSQTLEESIQTSKSDIETLKHTLQHEKKIRKNLEEYEEMAKLAAKYPSKKVSSEKLAGVKRKMDGVYDEEQKLDVENDVRKKQFQILLQSIFDLKSTLEEDEKEVKTDGDATTDASKDITTKDTSESENASIDVVPMDTTT